MLLSVVAIVGAMVVRGGIADARPSRAATITHVVAPGDTLWSIARQAKPHGDVGPVIAKLVRQNSLANAGAVLRPGDTLVLSSN